MSAVVLTSSQSSTAFAVGLVVTSGSAVVLVEVRRVLDVEVDRGAGERVERLRQVLHARDGRRGQRGRAPAAAGWPPGSWRRRPAAAWLTRIFSSCDQPRAPAHRVGRPGVVRDDERGVALPGEVDDHVGALAGRDQQRGHRHGRAQQPAVGADLRERQRPAAVLVGELQVVEARLRSVDDPEPVAARLDVDERPDLGVDDRDVAEELRHPLRVIRGHALRRVEHAPVGVERLVLQHERDLVRAGGQPERIAGLTRVLVVADEVERPRAPRRRSCACCRARGRDTRPCSRAARCSTCTCW